MKKIGDFLQNSSLSSPNLIRVFKDPRVKHEDDRAWISFARSLVLALFLFAGGTCYADNTTPRLPKQKWSFSGALGTFKQGELQRGFQVYKEVCSACHSLKRIRFRNLKSLGFNEPEIKAIATSYNITDGPNAEGQMFERKALPSDAFPSPYANDNAARAANNGALPPDLSLIIKAREGGADYVYALMNGYTQPPAGVIVEGGRYYSQPHIK